MSHFYNKFYRRQTLPCDIQNCHPVNWPIGLLGFNIRYNNTHFLIHTKNNILPLLQVMEELPPFQTQGRVSAFCTPWSGSPWPWSSSRRSWSVWWSPPSSSCTSYSASLATCTRCSTFSCSTSPFSRPWCWSSCSWFPPAFTPRWSRTGITWTRFIIASSPWRP